MNKLHEKYIPLDKSWMIRLGVLDLTRGYEDSIKFLEPRIGTLSDDLKSLHRASVQWNADSTVNVGESGTLFRFLRFADWKLGQDREFTTEGTLKGRDICNNPQIVNWDLPALLTLDNGTSQWASASVIMGSREQVTDPPYKLRLTYEAVQHWENARTNGTLWEARVDGTIAAQVNAYLAWLRTGQIEFTPLQAEDYCFARAFGVMTAEEGEMRWPSLRGHESDRIVEMEQALREKTVSSRDHRVVQAVSMLRGQEVEVEHPEAVAKTWPMFWEFLGDARLLRDSIG
jgi:hypothetical protein